MKNKIYIYSVLCILNVFLAACSYVRQPSVLQNTESTNEPDLTIGTISLDIPSFDIVGIAFETEPERNEIAANTRGDFTAFTTENGQLFIEDMAAHQDYEIQGIPLSYRPIVNLTWLTNNVLVFDRWSTPHYGVRYTVEFPSKRLISAMPFTDIAKNP